VSGWIGILDRIVSCIAIAIVVLRIVRVWYNGVRLGKVVKIRVVPAGVLEHEAKASAAQIRGVLGDVGVLSRIGVARLQGGIGCCISYFPPRLVARFHDQAARIGGHQAGRAEMVTQQILERTSGSHGDALRARIIVFGNCGAGHFIVSADEGRSHAIDGGFHSPVHRHRRLN